MNDKYRDYSATPSDDFLYKGTAAPDIELPDKSYSKSVKGRKTIYGMKEYPIKKTSFSKISYVQK